MADDSKRMVRTISVRESKLKKLSAFKSVSIFLGLQLPMWASTPNWELVGRRVQRKGREKEWEMWVMRWA